MTELEVHEGQLRDWRPTIVRNQDDMQTSAVARLGEWAHAAQAAYLVAERLVVTSFVPAQFKDKPEEAAAAILAGSEVGLSPMAALKSFDIIQGVAAPRAMTLRAIVQSQGHEMILVESTATRCKMRGRRRGEQNWQEVTWTIERAQALGLANKENWRKQPAAMLVARATAELARLVASDAILGIGYAIEELTDDPTLTESEPAEQPALETTTRTFQRPTEEAEPPPEPPADESPEPDKAAPGITTAQSKKMFAQFGELGISEQDDYRRYISTVIGRDIESSKNLTKDEANQVIESQIADLEARQ